MKFRKVLFPLALATLSLVAVSLESARVVQSNATFIENSDVDETFDKSSLSADTWISKDVSLSVDHYSLRMFPKTYQWGSHLLLSNTYLEEDYVLEVDLSSKSSDGKWLAISFGSKNQSATFADSGYGLIFYSMNRLGEANGCQAAYDDSNTLKTVTGDLHANPFTEYGVAKRLSIHVKMLSNSTSEVYFDLKDTDGNMLKEHDPEKDVYQVNRNLTGYIGFNNSGADVEINKIKILKENDNSEVIFEDDFTHTSIQYPTEGDGIWLTNSFSSSEVQLGPVNKLTFDKKGAGITYTKSLGKITSDRIDSIYSSSVEVSYASMSSNAFVGYEVAKANVDASSYMFGIKKERFGYTLMVLDEARNVISQETCKTNSPGLVVELNLNVKSNGEVVLCTNSITLKQKISNIEGYLGFSLLSLDNEDVKGPAIDNLKIKKTIENTDFSPDVAINFNGIQHKVAGYFEYDDFYIPKKDWYVTSTSDMFLSAYDDTIDPENPDGKLYYANSTGSTLFATRNKYTDYVLRFECQILTEVENLQEGAGFALEYGLNKFSTRYENAQTLGLFNTNASNPSQSLILRTHGEFTGANAGAGSISFPSPTSSGPDLEFLNLFEKRNGEQPTFDVMYIVKDGYCSMHFKYKDEDESVLQTPRAIVKADNSTYGYCGIVGNGGIDFSIDNFSITNLDYITSNVEYSAYADSQYQITTRKDFSYGDSSGLSLNDASFKNKALRISNGGSVSTSGKTTDGLYRIKFKSVESEANINLGDAKITLKDDDVTKKLIATDKAGSTEIDLGSDFNFTNSTLEFTKQSSTYNVRIVSGDRPLSAILDNNYEFVLSNDAIYNDFSISSVGITDLSEFTYVNYDSHTTIKNRNYDPATDTVTAWIERTPIQEVGKGCKGSIIATSTLVALLSLAGVVVLILKRKETSYEK